MGIGKHRILKIKKWNSYALARVKIEIMNN